MQPEEVGVGRLFRSIRDAVIVADTKTQQIVLWNPAATRVFGYSTSEGLELRVDALVPEYLRASHRAGIARYAETGHGTYINSHKLLELPALRKGGEEIRVELSLNPVRDVPGVDDQHFVLAIVRDITERKQAEEELREAEELFRGTFEDASIGMAVNDLDGRFVRVNHSLCQMLGYSEEELLSATFRDITHSDDVDASVDHVQRLLEREIDGYQLEKRYLHTEGHPVWVSLNVSLVRDSKDRPLYLIAQMQDITERKRAEEELRRAYEELDIKVQERTAELAKANADLQTEIAERQKAEERLREREARFRVTFEQAAVGVGHAGLNGRWLMVNRRLCDIVGYSREELLEKTFQEITHPGDLETDLRQVHRLLAGETGTYSMEKRYFRKDGSVVWINLTVSLVREPSGDPEYFISVVEDITERKRAEEKLRFLTKASVALASSLDYQATLASVARLAVPNLADWCAVDIVEDDGSLNRLAVAHEDPEKVTLAHELRERYPISSDTQYGVTQVLRTGESELVPEIPESLLDELAVDAEHHKILHELGLKSYMVVPLIARGRKLGAITFVAAESGRRYGPTDLETAEDLVYRAALAMDNAQLYRKLAEREHQLQDLVEQLLVAQEEERRRIAYDIHDGLTQTAFSAHQHLQAFASYHPPSSAEGQGELDRALELVRQTAREARRVIADLRPTELDDFGLATTLRLQAEELRAKGWQATYKETLGDKRLPIALETALYRVAQQALTNVRKHAQTTKVHLELKYLNDRIYLLVRDWGRGFNPTALTTNRDSPGHKVGLAGMQERVALLGGEFKLLSKSGTGTLILAKVPLREPREKGTDNER